MGKVTIEFESAVVDANRAALGKGRVEAGVLSIGMDVRKLDPHRRLGIPRSVRIHWHHETTISVQEFGALGLPIRYEITWADGYYWREGVRHSVTPKVEGVDIDRRVSERVVEIAMLLYVKGGVGLEATATLMRMIGGVEISKSSLDRWMREMAWKAPSAEEIFKELNRRQPITEVSMDEIYPTGQEGCAVVLRDEHGRIAAAEKLERKDWEKVRDFLVKMGFWGLKARVFYIDGCEAFRKAIRVAFPEAKIQLDLFHLLQSASRKLWKRVVGLRRSFRSSAELSWTPSYQNRMTRLAASLWEHRGLLFKAPENLTEEESTTLREVVEGDHRLSWVRDFWVRFRSVFHDSANEKAARQRVAALRRAFPIRRGRVFGRILDELEESSEEAFTFLRCRKVKRNSVAETGMRILRRLERNHDGFRTEEGLDRFLRLYQAITYLGWRPYAASG